MRSLAGAVGALAVWLVCGCAPPPAAVPSAATAAPPAGVPNTPVATGAAAASAALSPAVTVRVGVLGVAGDSGIFIGQERGYFQEEGITVEVTILGAGPDVIPPLA